MASQALITPGAKFKSDYIGNYSLVEGILFTPYWQMYGELNLEGIDNKIESNSARPTLRSLNTSKECTNEEIEVGYCEDFTKYNYVVKSMLAVYLLFGNVMLLNMLIAIFSNVFNKVEQNAKSVWWCELYCLVEEYDQMPGLGPLFFPFELVYIMIRGIKSICCCKNSQKNNGNELQDFEARSFFNEKLEMFEKDSVNTYIRRQAEKDEANFETNVVKKIEKLIEMRNVGEDNCRGN